MAKKSHFLSTKLNRKKTKRERLKNHHHSSSIGDSEVGIETMGHNVSNIYHRYSKDVLSMFYINMEQSDDNKKIYGGVIILSVN